MERDELKSAKQERDKAKARLRLLRNGGLRTRAGSQLEIDTTPASILETEQQLEAFERSVAELERENIALAYRREASGLGAREFAEMAARRRNAKDSLA